MIGLSSLPLTRIFLLDFELYLLLNYNHSFVENYLNPPLFIICRTGTAYPSRAHEFTPGF
jgi:hypothetical protein